MHTKFDNELISIPKTDFDLYLHRIDICTKKLLNITVQKNFTSKYFFILSDLT